MSIFYKKQTERRVLARLKRTRYGYWADRNMGIDQTNQTEYGYYQERSDMNQRDRNMGIGQTETRILVYLADLS